MLGRATVALALLLAGCKAEAPNLVNPIKADTAAPKLGSPRINDDVAVRTPLSSVALRGHTNGGTQIVVKGGASDVVKPPLPSGDFCLDVPLRPGAANALSISALGEGLISLETKFSVTQDSNYPPPPSPYCNPPACGEEACPTTETVCDDGLDNDLNGWTDQCDLACSGCVDDYFAPNATPANVPILPKGTYDLKLCPCHDDWLAFPLNAGQVVNVTISFTVSALKVDMKLFKAADAENGGYKSKTPVASSTSDLSPKSISYNASSAGTYYLWIYSRVPKQSGAYHLVNQ
jgi:hypothetical protein